jgi:hypothetical protein
MTTTIKNLTLDRVEVTSDSISVDPVVAPLSVAGNYHGDGNLQVGDDIIGKIFHGNGSDITEHRKWNTNYNDRYYTNGSISIGTDSLLQKLNVNGDVNVSGSVLSSQYCSKKDDIVFVSNGSVQMAITASTGYVGIGVRNPDAALHVGDDMRIRGDLIVHNNITVFGGTTLFDTENLLINNSFLIIGSNNDIHPIQDSGFIINRGDDYNVGMIWNDTDKEFTFVNTTSDGSETGGFISKVAHVDVIIEELQGDILVNASDFVGNGTLITNISQTFYRVFNVIVSGSGYIIDGVLKRELNLIRGKTYKFNLLYLLGSDPFTISTSIEGGSINIIYTNGVIGNGNTQDTTNKFLLFHVPYNTPDNLYYQSDSSSFFGAKINILGESIYDTDHNTKIYVSEIDTNETMHFIRDNVESITINRDGYVGIGTFPTDQLSVSGNILINGSLLVESNNSYDIGDIDHKFSNIYLGRVVSSSDTIKLDDRLLFKKDNYCNTTLTTDRLYTDIIYTNDTFITEGPIDNININKWKGYKDLYYIDGNVGIGTDIPTSKLHVIGNTTIEGITKVSEMKVCTINLHALDKSIWTNSVNNKDAYLDEGHVGINKLDPIHKLDVNGNIKSTIYIGDASLMDGMNLDKWKGDEYNELLIIDGNVSVVNKTVNINYMDGRVGIKTGTPREKLDINGVLMVGKTEMEMNGTIRLANTLNGPKYNKLIAWWKFDDNSSFNVIDSSMYDNNATLINMSDNWETGIIGDRSVFLDGISSYINGFHINLVDTSFSISLWVKRDVSNTFETLISQGKYANSYERLSVNIEVNNKVSFNFYNDKLYSVNIINDTNWHHIMITYNYYSKNRIIYIDGYTDNRNLSGDNYVGIGDINIGRSVNNSNYFTGKIDDIRIYRHVISQDDVLLIYNIKDYTTIQGYVNNKWVPFTENYKIPRYWSSGYEYIVSGFDASKNGISIILDMDSTETWTDAVIGNYIVFEDGNRFKIDTRVSSTEIEVEPNNFPEFITSQPYSIRKYSFNNITFNQNCDNNRIGIGTTIPNKSLSLIGNVSIIGNLSINNEFLRANVSELNVLSGIVSNVDELNILDNLTATGIEINYLSDAVIGIAKREHVLIPDSVNNINLGDGSLKVNNLYVQGNLTISTNISTINTQSLIVNSSTIFISQDQNCDMDGGFIIDRHNEMNVSMLWNERNNNFNLAYVDSFTDDGNVSIINYSQLHINNLKSDTNVMSSYYVGNGSRLTNLLTKYNDEFQVEINNTESNFTINNYVNSHLTLVKGQTYLFNLSNVSSEHVFSISTSPIGGNMSNIYTNGVITNSNSLIFTVPYDVSDNLYYQCNNHPNEGSKLDITNTVLTNMYHNTSVQVNSKIYFISNDTSVLTVTNSSYVGINTVMPNNSLDIVGNMSIRGDIYPYVNASYNFGSSDMVWNKAFFNDLYVNGSTIRINNKNIFSKVNNLSLLDISRITAPIVNASEFIVIEGDSIININKWNGSDNIYFMDGNIGIGTDNPTNKLHVIGNASINGTIYCNSASIYGIKIISDPSQYWSDIGNNNINYVGKVGINNISPLYDLDVLGVINASHFIGDGSLLTGIASDKWLGDSYNFISNDSVINKTSNIYNLNSITIGATHTPREKLDINGSITIGDTDNGVGGMIRYSHSFIDPCYYSLEGWWLLTEGSGTSSSDMSKNSNDLSFINTDNTNWITGVIGDYGFRLNGTTEYIDIGSDIDVSSKSFSMSIWIKRSIINIDSVILSQGDEITDGNLNIQFNIDNTLTFGFFDNDLITSSIFTDISEWHHYVFVYDKVTDKRSIYIDNVLDCSDIVTHIYIGTGNILIGRSINSNNYFGGDIDDIRIYTKALTVNNIDYVFSINYMRDFQGYSNNTWKSLTIKRPPIPLLWSVNESMNTLYYNPTVLEDQFGRVAIGKTTIENNDTLEINGSLNITNKLIIDNNIVTVNVTVLNQFTGITANSTNLNALSGVVVTTDNMNLLSDVIDGIAVENKILIADVNKSINMDGGSMIINDMTVYGNISVFGDLTRFHSRNLSINDSLVLLGYNQANATHDSGFVIERGLENDVGMIWDNSNNEFTFIMTNNTDFDNNVTIYDYTKLHVNNLILNGTVFSNDYIGNGSFLSEIDTFKWKQQGNSNLHYLLGNVGINTINPLYKLDINGTFYMNVSDNVRFKSNNIDQFVLNPSTGYVGINLNVPKYKLDVCGSSNIDNNIIIGSDIENNYLLNALCDVNNTNFSSSLHIKNNTSSLFYINATTNFVGIGTNIPSTNLDIYGNVSISDRLIINNDNTIITEDTVYVNGTINSTYIIGNGSLLSGIVWTKDIYNNNTYRLETNNIGIGTDMPNELLDIDGNISATRFIGNASQIYDITWSKTNKDELYIFDTNVSIGMIYPIDELSIVGTINAVSYIGDGSGLRGSKIWNNKSYNLNYLRGNVGINLNSPIFDLDINGTVLIETDKSNNIFEVESVKGNHKSSILVVNSTTNWISINKNNPEYMLDVNGTIKVNSSLVINSQDNYINNILNVNINNNVDTQSSSLHIQTRKDNNLYSKFYINASTNYIGVNKNSNLNSILDVNGSVRISETVSIGNIIPKLGGDRLDVLGIVNASKFIGNGSQLTGVVWSRGDDNMIYRLETNNIGIGTDNPTEYVDVNGTIKSSKFVGNGSGLTNIVWSQSGDDLYYMNGNVGINTLTVDQKLVVDGNIIATAFIGDGSLLTGASVWSINATNAFYTYGNVGMNMDTPSVSLDVNGSVMITTTDENNQDVFRIIEVDNNEVLSSYIQMNGTSHTIGINKTDAIYTLDVSGLGHVKDSLVIGVNNTDISTVLNILVNIDETPYLKSLNIKNSGISKFNIDAISGNVGLFIDDPEYKLHVNGNMSVSNKVSINHHITDDLLYVNGTVNATNYITNGSNLFGLNWKRSITTDNALERIEMNNVGIGTLVPTELLDVIGNISALDYAGNGSLVTDTGWVKSGSNIYYLQGNVGMNTDIPEYDLDIVGTLKGNYIKGDGTLLTGITSTIWIKESDNNIHYIIGNVGINTVDPQYEFDIHGKVLINVDSDLILNEDIVLDVSTTDGRTRSPLLLVSSDHARIGINNATPLYELDVTGDIIANNQLIIGDKTSSTKLLDVVVNGTEYVRSLSIKSKTGLYKNTQLFIDSTSGYVGINQDIANNELDINGTTVISNKVSINGALLIDELNVLGTVNASILTGNVTLGTNISSWSKNITDDIYILDSKFIGINTSFASDTLDVCGTIRATIFEGDGSNIYGITTWNNIDGELNYIDGNVAIRKMYPEYALDIDGNLRCTNLIGDGSLIVNTALWLEQNDCISYISGNVGIGNPDILDNTLSIDGTLLVKGNIDIPPSVNDKVFRIDNKQSVTNDLFSTSFNIGTLSLPVDITSTIVTEDNRIFFAGGATRADVKQNFVDIYDYNQNTWSHTTLRSKRIIENPLYQNKKIYYINGETDASVHSNEVDIYDTNINRWIYTTTSVGRSRFAAEKLSNLLIVTGGTSDGTNYLNNVDILNTDTDVWIQTTLKLARRNHTMVTLGSKVYIAGGETATSTTTNSIETYDYVSDTWAQPTTLSISRSHLSSGANYPYIIFTGGDTDNGQTNRIDIYNNRANVWSTFKMSHTGVRESGVTNFKNRIIIGGGTDGTDYSNRVDMFDTKQFKWVRSTLSRSGRFLSTDNLNINNKYYSIFAGGRDDTVDYNTIELLEFNDIFVTKSPIFNIDGISGYIGIGTDTPSSLLNIVDGDISIKSGYMIVNSTQLSVPDYVFESDYNLRPLDELKDFIYVNKFLPNIQNKISVKQDGLKLGSLQMNILEKIEELTLYKIQQFKQVNNINSNYYNTHNRLNNIEYTNIQLNNTLDNIINN